MVFLKVLVSRKEADKNKHEAYDTACLVRVHTYVQQKDTVLITILVVLDSLDMADSDFRDIDFDIDRMLLNRQRQTGARTSSSPGYGFCTGSGKPKPESGCG